MSRSHRLTPDQFPHTHDRIVQHKVATHRRDSVEIPGKIIQRVEVPSPPERNEKKRWWGCELTLGGANRAQLTKLNAGKAYDGGLIPGRCLSSASPDPHTHNPRMVKYYCQACGNADKLQRCSGCKTVRYCGRVCQRRDWKCHKSACRFIKTAKPAQSIVVLPDDTFKPVQHPAVFKDMEAFYACVQDALGTSCILEFVPLVHQRGLYLVCPEMMTINEKPVNRNAIRLCQHPESQQLHNTILAQYEGPMCVYRILDGVDMDTRFVFGRVDVQELQALIRASEQHTSRKSMKNHVE